MRTTSSFQQLFVAIAAVTALVIATTGTALAAGAPIVVTQAAYSIGTTTATLGGTVNPNGVSTNYHFEWGLTTGYGTSGGTTNAGSGTSALPVDEPESGFSPNTTYHFRLVATNSSGTTYGSDLTFKTSAVTGPPVVVTQAAYSIGTTTATLGGTVNPNGLSTNYHFEWGLTTSYGTSGSTTNAGSGTSAVAVDEPESGFSSNMTYHYRLVATNSSGTTYGSDLTFRTVGTPAVVTQAAYSIGTTTATLGGTVNPNGLSTNYHFEWGLTTSYGTTGGTTNAGSGTNPVAVDEPETGFSSNTTYHFRLVAVNSAGTSYGTDLTFKTNPVTGPPVVVTQAAYSIGSTSATLGGTVNPNGLSTNYHFEWGLTTSYGTSGPTTNAGSGSTAVAVDEPETGFAGNTTYHFRLVAVNSAGTTYGADLTFKTVGAPSVVTQAAYSIGTTAATLGGTVNPNGLSTNYHFEWGLTTGYGTSGPTTNAGSGTSAVAVDEPESGFSPNTTYHFRVVASNSAGTTYGSDLTFKTNAVTGAPIVVTQAAYSIGTTTATLGGTVNPNGLSTTYHFEWGLTTSYGSSGPTTNAGSGTAAVSVDEPESGLTTNTTYHFRLVATNSAGTTYGSDLTLRTVGTPNVVTQAAYSIGTTTATLGGTVNPNGLSTNYHFEWGLSTTYGTSGPTTNAGSGIAAVSVDEPETGFTANTTYHFRLVATNSAGTVYGSDLTFKTTSVTGPPTVVTMAAYSIGNTTATLGGTVNPNGFSATYHFEWGLTTSYGTSGPSTNAGSGTSAVSVDEPETGFAAYTTYHFRLVATNSAGTTYGSDQTFTTYNLQVTTSSPLSPGAVSIALNQSFAATGGVPPYSWTIASGSLPPGTTLSSSGVFSGTPSTAGTYSFVAQVSDAVSNHASGSLSLTIYAATSQDYSISSATWEGQWWQYNQQKGTWFPTIDSAAHFGIDGYSWGQVRTKSIFPLGTTMQFDVRILLNSGGTNGHMAYFGFGDQWVYYAGNFYGMYFYGGVIYLQQVEGGVATNEGQIGSYTPGDRITFRITMTSAGKITAVGNGFSGSFTPTTPIMALRGMLSDANDPPNTGLFVYSAKLATGGVALPIQISSITSSLGLHNEACLQWVTQSETDNYGFHVEKRSVADSNYRGVPNGFVPGHGTTLQRHEYSFVDAATTPGDWVYRLKQVDLDGTMHFSDGIHVTVDDLVPAEFSLSQNYPNPFNPSTMIRFGLPARSAVKLVVYNTLGQVVSTLVNGTEEAGYHEVKLDGATLASGVYLCRIQAGNVVKTMRMLMVR